MSARLSAGSLFSEVAGACMKPAFALVGSWRPVSFPCSSVKKGWHGISWEATGIWRENCYTLSARAAPNKGLCTGRQPDFNRWYPWPDIYPISGRPTVRPIIPIISHLVRRPGATRPPQRLFRARIADEPAAHAPAIRRERQDCLRCPVISREGGAPAARRGPRPPGEPWPSAAVAGRQAWPLAISPRARRA